MSTGNYGYIGGSAAKRLPRYFRCLRELLMNGVMRVSSAELAAALGITSSQVRSDLNSFGSIGQQGYGYPVKLLYTRYKIHRGGNCLSDVVRFTICNSVGVISYLSLDFCIHQRKNR